jgi:phosphatidylglycerol:prolipoprotein diacylglycerol transferase
MSYPYLSDLVRSWSGIELPLPLPMFGLFVAMAMLAAARCLRIELERLQRAENIDVSVDTLREAVSSLTVIAMASGIAGARIFHIFENLNEFWVSPIRMIWTASGLSIFGGLILGTLSSLLFIRWRRLPLRPFLDAAAPAMMLGYAIGRIGCQVSGDGDWGILADMALKPTWVPTMLWAQTYANNIVGSTIAWPGVYPTPMYEVFLAFICFGVLWTLRKHPYQSGWLFAVYMILAGGERLLIEQIRINPVLNFFGIHATQAEMISVLLILFGSFGVVFLSRRRDAARKTSVYVSAE